MHVDTDLHRAGCAWCQKVYDSKHENGGDICSRCGKEDYGTNFEDVEGKPVCEDCLTDEDSPEVSWLVSLGSPISIHCEDEMTQKDKINRYDALAKERDLLSLYFYDQETKLNTVKADAIKVREGSVRMTLYRANGAQGGYVVMTQKDASPHIELFEAMKDRMAKYYDNESLPIRLCLERLWVARDRMFRDLANAQSA